MSNTVNRSVVIGKTGSATGGVASLGNRPINISGLKILSNSASQKQDGRPRSSPVARKLSFNTPSARSKDLPNMNIPPPPPGFPFLNTGGYISYGYVISAPYHPSPESGSRSQSIGPTATSTPKPQGHSFVPSSVPTSPGSYFDDGGHSNIFDSSLIGESPCLSPFDEFPVNRVNWKAQEGLDQLGLTPDSRSGSGYHGDMSSMQSTARSLPTGGKPKPRGAPLNYSTQSAPPNYPVGYPSSTMDHYSTARSAAGYFNASGASTLCSSGCSSPCSRRNTSRS